MSRRMFRRGLESGDSVDERAREWDALESAGRRFHLVQGREVYIVHVRDPIGRHLHLHGEYEFDKVERSAELLGRRTLGTLVDVGANIGSACIPAVARGVVEVAIAIEPDPLNFAMLTANVAMNGLEGRIRCLEHAAGPENHREVLLELSEENKGDHRIAVANGLPRDRRSVSVRMGRLDSLVPSLDPNRDLVLMDVQGFEKFVLDGAASHMAEGVPIAMEVWPEGTMEHCGFDDLFAVVSSFYSHFFDLKPGSSSAPIPIGELGIFWEDCIRGDVGFGDVLLLRV